MHGLEVFAIDKKIQSLMCGGSSEMVVQVSPSDKVLIVGRAHYWATRSGVGIKTKYSKATQLLKIWRTEQ